MGPFLAGVAKALPSIGKFLTGAGSAAAGLSSIGSLLGIGSNQSRIRREDFDHHQNLADVANPREIARQSAFLEGIAPAQAGAYNTYQDATHGQDTQREITRMQAMAPVQAQTDLQYMDTVYAGTSPWERLGSNAAPSISAPAPTDYRSQGTDSQGFLQALVPLLTSQMNNDTQLKTALIQAQTSKEVAGVQSDTSIKTTGMTNDTSKEIVDVQTAGGTVPVNTALKLASEKIVSDAQVENIEASTQRTRTQTVIDRYAFFLSSMPDSMIRHLYGESKEKQGWREIMDAFENEMSTVTGTVNNQTRIGIALSKLPADRWQNIEADVQKAARMTLTGYESAVNFAFDKGKQYLPQIGKFAKTALGGLNPFQ
jgi:hypothetical protein